MTRNLDAIEKLFHQALEVEAGGQREALLDQLTDGQPELRAQVEQLLLAHDQSGDFFTPPSTFPLPIEDQPTLAPTGTGDDSTWGLQQLPCRFGSYELLERIAQGGMGVVFRARQTRLNRIVAVKTILSGEFAHPEEVDRFHIEAEAAGKLQHPGIVPIFDVGCIRGQHYFSMAFIDGQSLAARLLQEGPLDAQAAARMLKKIALAIQAAHEQGVVHRDLKPGNILIDQEGEPHVTDFGLAKRVETERQLTATGMVLGTPSYMPPEQAEGNEATTAADVYSLGAILYAMLTGQPPFSGDSQLETILQVLGEEATAPRKLNRDIPGDLETICLKCLEKHPACRYRSAQELADDLDRFLAGEPVLAKPSLFRAFRKWTLREPVLASHLGATLAMMLLITLCWLVLADSAQDTRTFYTNMTLLAAWAGIVWVFQKAQNRLKTKLVLPYAWAASNTLLMTAILAWNSPPRGTLVSLYLLLLISCSFARRPDLVVVSTIGSLVGYALLIFVFFQDSELQFPSYLLSMAVNIAVSGALLSLLSSRLRRLGDRPLI